MTEPLSRQSRVADALRRADYMNWSAAEVAEKIDGTVDALEREARRILLTELRAEVGKLDVHAVSGYEWECGNCQRYEVDRGFLDDAGRVCPHDSPEDAAISRAAVLALVDRHLREGEAAP